MTLPFTIDQFLGIFEKYNLAVWPMQIGLVLMAVLTLFLSLKKISYSDKTISLVLGFFWLWIGIVYHLIYFMPLIRLPISLASYSLFKV